MINRIIQKIMDELPVKFIYHVKILGIKGIGRVECIPSLLNARPVPRLSQTQIILYESPMGYRSSWPWKDWGNRSGTFSDA